MTRRVVIVTGGSRGIGAATAVVMATQGWDICLGYRAEVEAASRVVTECEAQGAAAVAVRVDVTEENDVLRFFDAASTLGPLGALVTNAGIVGPLWFESLLYGERARGGLDATLSPAERALARQRAAALVDDSAALELAVSTLRAL